MTRSRHHASLRWPFPEHPQTPRSSTMAATHAQWTPKRAAGSPQSRAATLPLDLLTCIQRRTDSSGRTHPHTQPAQLQASCTMHGLACASLTENTPTYSLQYRTHAQARPARPWCYRAVVHQVSVRGSAQTVLVLSDSCKALKKRKEKKDHPFFD